jgi:hypothetical protein
VREHLAGPGQVGGGGDDTGSVGEQREGVIHDDRIIRGQEVPVRITRR